MYPAYYNEHSVVFLDGKWLRAADLAVSVYTQSLHYGNCVFEGIRSYATTNGKPAIFKPTEHYERMHYSSSKIYLDVPYTTEQLTKITYELLALNGLTNAYIRPLAFAGEEITLNPSSTSRLLIGAWDWGRYLGNDLLEVMTSSFVRPHPKSVHIEAKVGGHYVNSMLAAKEAKQKGFGEALLLDVEGNVAEGSAANFFYERDGVLYTPALGHILSGITRATVIELCGEMGIEVRETSFTPDAVRGADSAFFTGTASEIAGIKTLDREPFRLDWAHSIGAELQRRYTALVTRPI